MGIHPNISADRFPKQGTYLLRRVRVVFNYDTSREFPGMIIRDDAEEPGRCIIKLDDGRVLLTTECQWHPESHSR
jgi:hypothetical protein